jgi:hypothetical protein
MVNTRPPVTVSSVIPSHKFKKEIMSLKSRPISFRPSIPDLGAIETIGAALADRTGSPFVDKSTAIRLALTVASRMAKQGRLFEHLDNPAHAGV